MRSLAIAIAVLLLQAASAYAQEAPLLNQSGKASAEQVADTGALNVSIVLQNLPAGDRGASNAIANMQQIGGEMPVQPEQKDSGRDAERNSAEGGVAMLDEGTGGSNSPDGYQPLTVNSNANGVWQLPRSGALNSSALQQAGPTNLAAISQH
jgi:hypothetical protein